MPIPTKATFTTATSTTILPGAVPAASGAIASSTRRVIGTTSPSTSPASSVCASTASDSGRFESQMWATVAIRSTSRSAASKMSTGGGSACRPTITTWPPRLVAWIAMLGLAGTPEASITTSAPSPAVASRIAAATSVPRASIASSAPSASASASLFGSTSTAIRRRSSRVLAAPIRKPPIPPMPSTATVMAGADPAAVERVDRDRQRLGHRGADVGDRVGDSRRRSRPG